MKRAFFPILLTALTVISCSKKEQKDNASPSVYNAEVTLPGDSTLYGLACEGCTDSLLIYLPLSGGDPDTLNILAARVNHRIFGLPEIGDQMAIILNSEDKSTADLVINLDRLKGEWCYQVMPHLRPRAGVSPDSIVQLPPDFPDSLRKKWFQPREYGIEFKKDRTARAIGSQTRDHTKQQTPVTYPTVKRYRQWQVFNGHILLMETSRDTLGSHKVISTDTVDIVLLRPDSLRLRFKNHEQGYYRKN